MDEEYYGDFLLPGISVPTVEDDDGFIAPTPEELSCCHEEWEDWV